jgi:hypothetical protein
MWSVCVWCVSSPKFHFIHQQNRQVADDKDKRLRLLEDRAGVVVQGLEEMVVKNAAGEGGGGGG